MELTEQQRRALDHAREVLAEAPPDLAGAALPSQWYATVRRTLDELVTALDAD